MHNNVMHTVQRCRQRQATPLCCQMKDGSGDKVVGPGMSHVGTVHQCERPHVPETILVGTPDDFLSRGYRSGEEDVRALALTAVRSTTDPVRGKGRSTRSK